MALAYFNIYALSKELGSLPCSGGIFSQPNRLIEAFRLIMSAINEKNEIDKRVQERDLRVYQMEMIKNGGQ